LGFVTRLLARHPSRTADGLQAKISITKRQLMLSLPPCVCRQNLDGVIASNLAWCVKRIE
jgi:hypothetical protein